MKEDMVIFHNNLILNFSFISFYSDLELCLIN